MDRKTLIEKLESYDMRETATSPGFRNTLTNIHLLTQIIYMDDYTPKDVETLQTQYRLLADHYSAIDFSDLEPHKDEPAVLQLFETRRLIIGLGFAIWGLVDGVRKQHKVIRRNKIGNERPLEGYQETIAVLEMITDFDRNSHYRNRVRELRTSI